MRHCLAVILGVLCFCGPALSQEKTEPIVYDLKVRIEPAQGSISVSGTMEIPAATRTPEGFTFALHETFVIRKLLICGNEVKHSAVAKESVPVQPASQEVNVVLPAHTPPGSVHMQIEYDGKLKNLPEFGASPDWRHSLDDQINSRMVELASYSSWYPQFPFGVPLQVELEVNLPGKWVSICSGKRTDRQLQGDREITRWISSKDIDIVVLASPNYKEKSFRQSGVDVQIYYTQIPDQFIQNEVGQIAGVVGLFTDRLGRASFSTAGVKHVYSPKRKGQGKAGFSRPGLIVTSEGLTLEALAADPKFSLFQGIAHEVAHFWWNFGAGQGDWINEAFAEYFSAIAVEKLVSADQYNAVLADYGKQVKELPPAAPSLAIVPFADGQDIFVVRYYNGALMLNKLRKALGDEQFFNACREFFQLYTGKSIGTTQFRGFWEAQLGNRRKLVDDLLDAKGSLPNL